MHRIIDIDVAYELYLRDESSQEGTADSISFPDSAEDAAILLERLGESVNITIQGARTGYEGKAVPNGGHIMNFSHMNRILESGIRSESEAYISVQAGVTLEQLETETDKLFKRKFFWPPCPTEKTATLGGIAATSAHGMNACHYGDTWAYIYSVKRLGDEELGPISELKLKLLPRPESIWGLAFFFIDADDAISCADGLQNYETKDPGAWLTSMEYFDRSAISIARELESSMPGRKAAPPFPDDTDALIYIEIEGEEDAIEQTAVELMEFIGGYGSDPDTALALIGYGETERMHVFRHSVTEAAVQQAATMHTIDNRITKLGIRRQHRGIGFRDMLGKYTEVLDDEKLRYAICAGIRNSETDIAILPGSYDEYCRGKVVAEKEDRYE